MVEILIVIGIVALLAALGMFLNLDQLSFFENKEKATAIQRLFEKARMTAQIQGSKQILEVSKDEVYRCHLFAENETADFQVETAPADLVAWNAREETLRLPKSWQVLLKDGSEVEKLRLYFYSDGQSSAATLRFQEAEDSAYLLDLDPLTGKVDWREAE